MDELTKTMVQFFDLEDVGKEVQEDFLEDIGEAVMGSIFNKAWSELDSKKQDELNALLEESTKNPDDVEKREAVLLFLDDNMINLTAFIEKELEMLQKSYREKRDEFRDAVA
jgi:hypothetical protein